MGIVVTAGCTSSSSKPAAKSSSVVSAPGSAAPSAAGPTGSASGTGSASNTPPAAGQSSSSPGSITQTVPSVVRTTVAPVPLTATASFGTGVTAHITSLQAVNATAEGPGEISGPGLKFVVELTNGTAASINLDTVVMTVADAQSTPGVQMSQSGSAPFTGILAAHAKASGTYVFTLPPSHRNPITVDFSYSSKAPVALFVGDAK